MAERVLQFTVLIPTPTNISSPLTVPLPLDGWEIEAITLEVPPGPAGDLGFVLANNGVPWIPRSPGEWIVWDDRVQTFAATDYPTGAGWQVIGYNVGAYDHTVVARFHVNPTPAPAASAVSPVVLTFIERDIPAHSPVTL